MEVKFPYKEPTVMIIVVALILISVVPGTAMAQTVGTSVTPDLTVNHTIKSETSVDIYHPKPTNESVLINENGEYSASSTNQRVGDKKASVTNTDGMLTPLGTSTISDSESMAAEGSSVEVQTEMDYSWGSGIKGTFDASGMTNAFWWGLNPYNADEIRISTTVGVDGIAVTISIPPAMSSGSGYSATVTKTFSDVWHVDHSYSGFHAESWVAVYNGYQKDSGTFTFDNSAYTVFTNVNVV